MINILIIITWISALLDSDLATEYSTGFNRADKRWCYRQILSSTFFLLLLKKEHNSNFSTARSEAEKKASDTTDEAISGGASTSKYENARLPLVFHHSETGWRASETTKVFFGEPGGISMHHSQES